MTRETVKARIYNQVAQICLRDRMIFSTREKHENRVYRVNRIKKGY